MAGATSDSAAKLIRRTRVVRHGRSTLAATIGRISIATTAARKNIVTAARSRIAAKPVRKKGCPAFRSCKDKNAGRERPDAKKKCRP